MVDNLVFGYKLARGTWNMDLAEAVGKLEGRHSLATRQAAAAGDLGLTWISSPSGVMAWHANLTCISFCGACSPCLSDKQVICLAASQS